MYRMIYVLLVIAISGCDLNENCSDVYALEEEGRYEKLMRIASAWELCPTDSPEKESYRFVWLRASHNPIVISLVKAHGRIETTATRLDGTGAADPGSIAETRTMVWTQAELDQFKDLIDKMDFWNLKSLRQLASEGSTHTGQDTTRWILEGANQDKANAVDRGSDVAGPFREAALLLLEKSKINPNGEIY